MYLCLWKIQTYAFTSVDGVDDIGTDTHHIELRTNVFVTDIDILTVKCEFVNAYECSWA